MANCLLGTTTQPAGSIRRASTMRRRTLDLGRFVTDLSAILGMPISSETGHHIQDASFHSQATLPLPDGQWALIRFSNFGHMVTVSGDEPVPEPLLTSVLERS